ncbi:DUF4192 domain-containing protein [Arthrobacter monumenti]
MTNEKPYRIRTSADILSYIPHALGFWPRESAVFITMRGGRVGATLRVDLPDDPTPNEAGDFAEQIRDYLGGDTTRDSTIVALYTDAPWGDQSARPHSRIMDALEACLAFAGIPIRDAWWISGSVWRDYFCDDIKCCPWPGRPIDDITSSELNAELVFRGSHYGRSIEEATGIGPELQVNTDRAIEEAIRENVHRVGTSWLQEDQFAATMGAWQTAVDTSDDGSRRAGRLPSGILDEDSAGFLLASLTCKTVRDCLLVQISVGPETALKGALSGGLLSEQSGALVVPDVLKLNHAPGRRTDEDPDGAAEALAVFQTVLVGGHDGPPDWRTINRAADVFKMLLQFSSGPSSTALLTMLSWIEWTKGRGSHAQSYLDKCLELDPKYKLAVLLEQLFATGRLPRWATRADTAWSSIGAEAA